MLSTDSMVRRAQLIRLALITGVLVLGAVVPLVRAQPGWNVAPLPIEACYALVALAMATVPATMLFRRAAMREPNVPARLATLLCGWAVGEGVGLFGGTIFLLTGQSQWFFLGLVPMAYAFGMLRIRAVA